MIETEAGYDRLVAPVLARTPEIDRDRLRRIADTQAHGDAVVWL